MAIKDYYATLGLPFSASHGEVKRSYRQLVKQVHPDAATGRQGAARFLEIQEAYEALSDPVRRAAYDRRREVFRAGAVVASERPSGFWSDPGVPAASITDDSWEGLVPFELRWVGEPATAARPAPGRSPAWDLRMLTLTLEEAFRGTETILAGVRVRIPPGARDGMLLRIPAAAGGGVPSSPVAPHLVQIVLRPHSRFRVQGDNLYVNLAVSRAILENGGRVRLKTPGGPLTVAIPPRLSAGRVLRLRGRGLPATALRRAGDILITLASAG